MSKKKKHTHDENWDDRVLCRDESCIGTIGTDGRCRVCGLPSEDGPVAAASSGESDTPESTDRLPGKEGADTTLNDAADFTDTGKGGTSDWEERILCRDESCIGTIGPDGRCRVCGLAYRSDSAGDND